MKILFALLCATVHAIYPPDHFDFVHAIHDSTELEQFTTTTTTQTTQTTAFIRWIASPG